MLARDERVGPCLLGVSRRTKAKFEPRIEIGEPEKAKEKYTTSLRGTEIARHTSYSENDNNYHIWTRGNNDNNNNQLTLRVVASLKEANLATLDVAW